MAKVLRRARAPVAGRFRPWLIALVCLTCGCAIGASWPALVTGGIGGGHLLAALLGGKQARGAVKSVCEDTCVGYARNGVCDDGRPTPGSAAAAADGVAAVHCDLGTDCSDCGPWVHNNTDASDSWRPIAELKAKQLEVYRRRSGHPSAYWMAFTSGEQDIDVSRAMHEGGLFEPGYTWAWHYLLRDGCRGPGGERRLVVDVGANFGYYTLLSAAMGCRVVAWEPVPFFAAYLKYGLLLNNLTHLVELREAIAGNSSGGEATIVVPNRGIWGTAGIDGANIDTAIANEARGDYDRVVRRVERVDEAVREDVLVMKVDVEGFEPSVLRGAKRLLLGHTVSTLIFEYSPGVAERAHDWDWFEENPKMLMGLLRGGYTLLHLANIAGDPPDWGGQRAMSPMEQITQDVLRHDIEDAWRLQDGTLGCHNSDFAGVSAGGAGMFSCSSLPEGLDPQSFRYTFGHNTNVVAVKGAPPPWATLGAVSSLAPLDFDIRGKFFIPGGVFGAGRRMCAHLEPQVQVAHRCPCTNQQVCGALEERVKQLAAEGLLPPFAVPGRTVEPASLGIESW